MIPLLTFVRENLRPTRQFARLWWICALLPLILCSCDFSLPRADLRGFIEQNTTSPGKETDQVVDNTDPEKEDTNPDVTTPTFLLSYDSNNGSGVMDSQTLSEGAMIHLPESLFSPPTENLVFAGWNTLKTGAGVSYGDKSPFTMTKADVILYAQWIAGYRVYYHPNGAPLPLGGMVDTELKAAGLSYTLWANQFGWLNGASFTSVLGEVSGNANSIALFSGFLGWNTEAKGTGTTYAPGATIVMPEGDLHLYAQYPWSDHSETATDYHGNVYQTVRIGNQLWTTSNLRATQYTDGTVLFHPDGTTQWKNTTEAAYCSYNNNPDPHSFVEWGTTYNFHPDGFLYNYHAIAAQSETRKFVLESGWRVPTNQDFYQLNDFLRASGYHFDGTADENGNAKSLCATQYWNTYPTSQPGHPGYQPQSNDTTGFSAVPTGSRNGDPSATGDFQNPGRAMFWTIQQDFFQLQEGTTQLSKNLLSIPSANFGYAIRLVKDAPIDGLVP